jgi:hypothetical protein
MMHGTRSGYNNGCRCPPCTSANTEAQRKRRRSLPSHALHSARGWESPGIEAGTNESTANRSGSGGGVDLWDMLGRTAETFLANHPAMVTARTAAGAHVPAVTPVVAARSTSSRSTAAQFLLPPPPQVSRVILPGRPAYRLVVSCGCPFGWDTPDMPDVVVCPKHGNARVASGSSSETWSGGPLPIPVTSSLT